MQVCVCHGLLGRCTTGSVTRPHAGCACIQASSSVVSVAFHLHLTCHTTHIFAILAHATHTTTHTPHHHTSHRICLEEDGLSALETPCGCTGTQRYAHKECIQKWVNEKHHTTCEICDQAYKGE